VERRSSVSSRGRRPAVKNPRPQQAGKGIGVVSGGGGRVGREKNGCACQVVSNNKGGRKGGKKDGWSGEETIFHQKGKTRPVRKKGVGVGGGRKEKNGFHPFQTKDGKRRTPKGLRMERVLGKEKPRLKRRGKGGPVP